MKILIAGGTGFIGSELARYAKSKGHEALTLDIARKPDIEMDIRNEALRMTDLSEFDMVMDFAAVTLQTEFAEHPAKSFQTNVDGLFNLAYASMKSGVPKFVFASSSAVSGRGLYAMSKRMGEELILGLAEAGAFEGLSLRFFNCYGVGEDHKGQSKSMVSQFAECKAQGKVAVVYGDGEQRRDFIHVRDAARIAFELSLTRLGVVDVGSGKSRSFNSILDALGIKQRKYISNPMKFYQTYTQAKPEMECEITLEQGLQEVLEHYRKLPRGP